MDIYSRKESNLVAKSKKNETSPKQETTMDSLLAKYQDSFRVFARGDRVKGKVIEKLPKRLILDIAGKSEGMVSERAFDEARGFIDHLELGDEVEGVVLIPENPEGYTIVSLRKAAASASWKKLIKAKDDSKTVEVTGRFPNPSGFMVEAYGLYGFIPNSQLSKDVLKNKEKFVGQNMPSIVLEVDEDSNRLVFSEKAISEGITPKLVGEAMGKVNEGDVISGIVTTVSDFGCFVEFEIEVSGKKIPLEGLVHVSELAWEKVGRPADVVKKGQKVKVRVISTKGGRIALSMKQAQDDPWTSIGKKYKVEQKVTGKVVKMTDFGAFVQLEPGVEGLIHITKIPPEQHLRVGDEVKAVIEEIDSAQRKMSLGIVLTQKPLLYK